MKQYFIPNHEAYRTAFYISLLNGIFCLIAAASVGVFFAFFSFHRSVLDLAIGISVLICSYVSIVYFLPKKMAKEKLIVWNPKQNTVDEVGIRFYWGFLWRWFVISAVISFIVGVLKGLSNEVAKQDHILDLIIWLFCSLLAIVWLLKYQYGMLRVKLIDTDWEVVDTVKSKRGGGMLRKLSDLATGTLGFLFIGMYILFAVGELYWLWMSFQIGSFGMFVIGLIPPFMLIAMVVGAYGLVFGMPAWVYSFFG